MSDADKGDELLRVIDEVMIKYTMREKEQIGKYASVERFFHVLNFERLTAGRFFYPV